MDCGDRQAIEPRGDHLLANLQGRETGDEMREFLIAVHAACQRHGCPKILMSVRASRPVFKPEEYGISTYVNELITERCQVALEHARYFEGLDDGVPFQAMRKHLGWYVKGLTGSAELRRRLHAVVSLDQVESIFDDYLRNREHYVAQEIGSAELEPADRALLLGLSYAQLGKVEEAVGADDNA